MPPERSIKSRRISRPEAGLNAWSRLQHALENERKTLKQIPPNQDSAAALLAQEGRLGGLKNSRLMEQMFIEGCIRHPEQAQFIKKTRQTYLDLVSPFVTPKENQKEELLQTRNNLLVAFQELQRQIHQSVRNNTPLVIILNLESAHEVLEEYQDLSGASTEVCSLVGEIKLLLRELDQLAKQFLVK